ncbi:hypothetical protein [Flavobacterium anhuiense]|uniref:hypothetical protein n=1 Tax=Flavobacterium anhuiense TaxID=459526 RepID=UPI003D9A01EB
MKQLLAILIIVFSFASCDSEDQEVDNSPLTTTINIDVTYPKRSILSEWEINFKFEYDNNGRLIKKNGGYGLFPADFLYNAYFNDQMYTTLTYVDNKVTVQDFSEDPIAQPKIFYVVNGVNRIEEKEKPNLRDSQFSEKLFYKYSGDKLIEIVTVFPYRTSSKYVLTYSEKFYYDRNNNLIKTESEELHNGVYEGIKTVRTFEDYDTSLNPFKRLNLLEEYFYRSLSKNNFRKYTEERFDMYLGNLSSRSLTWTFQYNNTGTIIIRH